VPNSTIYKSAGKAVIWTAFAKWFEAVAGLLSLFVLVRILGPDLYGLFGMGLVMLALPQGIVGGPLAESLIQRREISKGHETATFISDVTIAILLCLLLSLTAPITASIFKQDELIRLIPVMSLLLPIAALGSVPGALLQRELRFKEVSLVDATGTATASSIGIAMALLGFGVWSLVFMELSRRTVRTLGFCFAANWFPKLRKDAPLRKHHFWDLFRFNSFTITTKLLGQLDNALPGAIIGVLLGTQALGIFNLVTRVFKQGASILLAPMQAVTMPLASKTQTTPTVLVDLIKKGTRLSTVIAYPFFIGLAAVSALIVPLFFGKEWIGAILPMQLMMLMGVRAATASFNGGIIRGAGRPELQTGLVAVGLFISVPLLLIAAPYGISAIVGAVLVRGLITWVIGAFVLQRLFGYKAIDQFIIGWESLISAGIMFAAVVYAQIHLLGDMHIVLTLMLSIGLGAIVHTTCMALLAPQLLGDFRRFVLTRAVERSS